MTRTMGEEPREFRIEMLKVAANYALPIFWDESGIVKHNGTAFILNTGEKIFGVTASHVYGKYLADFQAGIVETCRLANINLPLQDRLISRGITDTIDIATFELTQSEIHTFGARILSGDQNQWPPSPPQINWAVVVSGYPGVERIQLAKFASSFGATCFNIPISSVSEYQFGCAFERQHWIDEFGKGLPRLNCNLGGISGAPVLTLIERESGLATWRLAGVAYQASASEILGEILFVNHARLIAANGMIHGGTYKRL